MEYKEKPPTEITLVLDVTISGCVSLVVDASAPLEGEKLKAAAVFQMRELLNASGDEPSFVDNITITEVHVAHDTGGNAGIAWTGVPTENAGVMRGGTPLYEHPQPPSEQAEVANDSKWLGPFTTASEALNELRMAIATMMGCDQNTWPDHGNAPLAIAAAFAIRQTALKKRAPEQDDVRAAPQPPSAQPTLTAEIVERRLRTWRQRFVDRSGDQLALGDFLDRESLDDLVDFVCDEYSEEAKR